MQDDDDQARPQDDPAMPEGPEPAWMKLLAPLRSEDAAFRALIAVAGFCGVVIAAVLLVRAL